MEQLFIAKRYVEARRIKEHVIESGLRVYPNDPSTTIVQIRARSKSTADGSGTIAHVNLDRADLLQLREFIDAELARIRG